MNRWKRDIWGEKNGAGGNKSLLATGELGCMGRKKDYDAWCTATQDTQMKWVPEGSPVPTNPPPPPPPPGCPRMDNIKSAGANTGIISWQGADSSARYYQTGKACSGGRAYTQDAPYGLFKMYNCGRHNAQNPGPHNGYHDKNLTSCGICSDCDSTHKCLGSSTTVRVIRNSESPQLMTIGDLIPGDKVLSYSKKGKSFWDKVYHIRNHGFTKTEHISIKTNDDVLVGTKEHLIYVNVNNQLKRIRFDELDCNMKLVQINDNNVSHIEILEINKVDDIPLTPCTISGKLCIGTNILASCWSHSEEHAKKMDSFNILSAIFTNILPINWCSNITKVFYEKCVTHLIH